MTQTAVAEVKILVPPGAAAEAAEYLRKIASRVEPNGDTFIPSIEAPSTLVTADNAAELIQSTAELLDKAVSESAKTP